MNTIMWFIGGTLSGGTKFIFGGGSGYRTRKEAIRAHEKACGREWKDLKRSGDFAVKCEVRPVEEPTQ